VPGFAVFFQAHLFGFAVGVEAEHGLRGADFYRDYVPDIQRDYVGGYEIYVALGVDGAAFAYGVLGAGFVGSGAEALGAFDLDAEELHLRPGAVIEDVVVFLAVAEGLGDGEAALVAAVEESYFGMLSGAFGVVKDAAAGRGLRRGLRRLDIGTPERRKAEIGAPLRRDFLGISLSFILTLRVKWGRRSVCRKQEQMNH
jgi:hypothetical protein